MSNPRGCVLAIVLGAVCWVAAAYAFVYVLRWL